MSSLLAQLGASYRQQGFVSGVPVLNQEELETTREAFSRLEREFGKEYAQYSLHNVHLQYGWVMDLATHPKVLELVKAILGPDVILLDSRFICKYPVAPHSSPGGGEESDRSDSKPEQLSSTPGVDCGKLNTSPSEQQGTSDLPFVAWHQDIRYWGVAGGPVLSVWLALDDSFRENGALQVIPGSHTLGILPHQSSARSGNMLSTNQEIPEHLLLTDSAQLCPLQAGQMSVHDGLLVHGSEPNTSSRRRCGFVIRFVPTSAFPVQDPDRPRHFPATVLVSGRDQFKHFPSSTPTAALC